MENKKCLICDNLLKSDKLKTCSRQCADELKKINSREVRKCCNCNNDFLVRKKVEKKLCSEECRRVWNSIPENKNLRIKNSKISLKEKYGTDKILGLKFIRDKAKETKLEKYGNENFVNNKKAKETKLDRYNDENYNNNKKSKETKLDRYNDENYNNRQAAKESMIKKYGVGHAMKLPEYQIKQQDTLKKNYGVTSPLQNLDIKEKTKKTNIERYGFNNPSKSDSIKLKIKKALLSKFDETLIFEKMLKTNIELISNYDGLRNGTKQFFYDFKCLVCNMEFQGTFSNSRPPICRVCNPMYKNNLHQIEFRNFFINNNIKFFENDKQAIKPFELDFYLPDYNFAVELNGNYYHSEIGGDRDSDYHIKKTKMCLEKEVTLLHFFEDEIIQKKNIIYSMILSKMDLLKIIHAKKCTIKEVSSNEKSQFLIKNHIQSDVKDSIRIGLYYNNELICLMSFLKMGKSLENNSNNNLAFEMVRFCTKISTNIVEGFSVLLNFFINNYSPTKIVAFSDNRFSSLNPQNTLYFENKFEFTGIIKPRYWYFKKGCYLKRYHRLQFNKKKLLKEINRPELTEWDIAQLLGMDRIWDCGSLKFEMNII